MTEPGISYVNKISFTIVRKGGGVVEQLGFYI